MSTNLTSCFTAICDAIRSVKGTTAKIAVEDIPTEISSIPSAIITPAKIYTKTLSESASSIKFTVDSDLTLSKNWMLCLRATIGSALDITYDGENKILSAVGSSTTSGTGYYLYYAGADSYYTVKSATITLSKSGTTLTVKTGTGKFYASTYKLIVG